jgi:hypothetical protein
MDLDYQQHIPADFAMNSKVWVYQSSRLLSMGEAFQLEDLLNEFVTSWKSHGATVKGYANLFFGRFIVFMADETATGVSGCSTDSSVRVVKQIEELFKINLFDRQSLAFIVKDKIEHVPMAQLNYALQNGFITADTLYFNNLVADKKSWLNNWLIPVQDSWLNTRLKLTT